MIKVDNLTKNYGPVRAVDDASFSVEEGETVGFLGPNGAGKTTTMRIMTGLFPPSSGDVSVDGYSVLDEPLEVKRRIGYLPENTPVYLDMSVESYLRFVAEIKGVPRAHRIEQIEGAIDAFGLEDMRRRTAKKLSKGYRQRLGLAQAVVGNPPVIILDEPTMGLDPSQTSEFRKLIHKLKADRTIILSSHILPEVSMICDRVVIISEGRIVAQDTLENLSRNRSSATHLLVTIDGPEDAVLSDLSHIAGIAEVEVEKRPGSGGVQYRVQSETEADPRGEIIARVADQGWKLLELQVVTAGLEEVFLNLVTEETQR